MSPPLAVHNDAQSYASLQGVRYLATHQKMQAETIWLVGQLPLDIRQV
jgi:hypothetical protein